MPFTEKFAFVATLSPEEERPPLNPVGLAMVPVIVPLVMPRDETTVVAELSALLTAGQRDLACSRSHARVVGRQHQLVRIGAFAGVHDRGRHPRPRRR